MHELIKRLIGQLDGQRSNLWHFQARPRRLWGAGGTGAHRSHSPRCCRSDTCLSAVAVCLPLIFSGGVPAVSKSCGLFQGLTSNSELLSRSLPPDALGPASVSSATGIDIAWLVPGESWVMHGPPEWILFWGLLAPSFTVDQRAEWVIKYNRPTGTVFSGPGRGGERGGDEREWDQEKEVQKEW